MADLQLIEEFNRAMEELQAAFERKVRTSPSISIKVLLHQLINKNADDSTLTKIIQDVRTQIAEWSK